MTSLLERELKDKEFARLFAQESLITEATELVCRAMERRSVNKSELAERAGVSKSHITQLLSGSRNMTLRTLADLMFLLEEGIHLNSTQMYDSGSNTRRFVFDIPTAKRLGVKQWEMTPGAASMGQAA